MKIYEPAGRAREYSPLALNFKQGCNHNCNYCYVPTMFKRYNVSYRHDVEICNPNFLEIEKSAKKYYGCDKQILLSFTGDPYSGNNNDDTTKILEILLKYNHKVSILTKGGSKCLNDIELFKKFGDKIKVGATLTFDNESDSIYWESGAALPFERIRTLKKLAENGIKTWVSFEPVIIPSQSLALLEDVSSFIDSVKIGKINNFNGLDKKIDWNKFIKEAVFICRSKNIPFYIKKDLQKFNKETLLYPEELDEDFLNL